MQAVYIATGLAEKNINAKKKTSGRLFGGPTCPLTLPSQPAEESVGPVRSFREEDVVNRFVR